MIGLRFKVKNEYNNFLQKIFESVDVKKYSWDIITDDVILGDNANKTDGIFNRSTLNGDEFLDCICKDKYYMIFVDLKAFPVDKEHIQIMTFNDFINSDCEIILLCVDSEFVEIYAKERLILDTVQDNCIRNCFTHISSVNSIEAANQSMIAY